MTQYPNNVNQMLNKETKWEPVNNQTTGTQDNINSSAYNFDELVNTVKANERIINKHIEYFGDKEKRLLLPILEHVFE